VSEGGYLRAAVGRGMEHDRDEQACVTDEAEAARPDLLVQVEALSTHAGHHLPLCRGEAVGAGGHEVPLLTERRHPGPEEPPLRNHRGDARRLGRKIRYEPTQLPSRHGCVCASDPFIEFIDRQAADGTLLPQSLHDRIPLTVARAKLLGHRH
jgi:hypothetical protein